MELEIKSNISACRLVFSKLSTGGEQYVDVEFRGNRVQAGTTVYLYAKFSGLDIWFQELGRLERPWDGAIEWISIERDFRLIVTCSRIGHVHFDIEIHRQNDLQEESSVSAGLMTDLAALQSIAKDAQTFFGQI